MWLLVQLCYYTSFSTILGGTLITVWVVTGSTIVTCSPIVTGSAIVTGSPIVSIRSYLAIKLYNYSLVRCTIVFE